MAVATLVKRKRRRGFPHRRRFAGAPFFGDVPTVTFAPGTPLRVRAWIALVPDFTRPWWEWNWSDITDYVRWDPGVATSQGRRDQDSQPVASTARATLDNSDGRFSRLNPYSPYYGLLTPFTPIRFALDPGTGFNHRYFGFVNSWPKRWDRSANDPTIPIVCRGPLHRVLRSQTLGSALRRTISGVAAGDYRPHAYWALEDGSTAASAASALPGGSPMTVSGTVTFAADSDLTGSEPLAYVGPGASLVATVPAYTDQGQWLVQVAVKIPAEPAADTSYIEVREATGTVWKVEMVVGAPGSVYLNAYDSFGTLLAGGGVPLVGTGPSNPSEDDFYDRWLLMSIGGYDSLGSAAGFHGVTSGQDGLVYFGSGMSGFGPAHGAIQSVHLRGGEGAYFGHCAVYVDPNVTVSTTGVNDIGEALDGWAGEMAHERIARLCREASITLRYDCATSAALGPQPTGRLLNVLQDSAKAAQGVLYEYEFGLGYQDIRNRENQPVAMTVDIAEGQVVEDLEPADDDLRFHNQWTVSRPNGSSVTAEAGGELTDGDLEYAGADTFQVETDAQLAQLAGWLLHTDTRKEEYWPNIAINLAKHPSLIPDWLALPYGARINVTNVMDEAGVDTIDAIVEGHTEHFNSLQWSARLNTSPASVYTVGVLNSDQRLDSATSTFSADISDSETSLLVATTDADELWTTDSAEMPFEIEIWPGPPPDTSGGEVMTVTAISGSSSPQTFTVTRGTNGIAKAHKAGAEVHVHNPIILAY